MSLLKGLYSLSGEAEEADRWSPVRDPAVRSAPQVPKMPSWLTEHDLDFLEGNINAPASPEA